MTITVSLTEDAIVKALGDFITSVLPDGVAVIKGQENFTTMPPGTDFVLMTPARREQLSQTEHDYDPDAGTEEISRSTSMHFQLDVYGPGASDNTQIITTLFRDDYGFQFFIGLGLAPLYCDDGQQMPLISGEKTWIQRWMMRGLLQTDLAVTVPREFADTLITTLVEVDQL